MTAPTPARESRTYGWLALALALVAALVVWGKVAVEALVTYRLAEYLAGLG